MQYKSIIEQNNKLISILKENKDLMLILDYINSLKIPNYYIVAGSIFQTVWNYYDNKLLNSGKKDIDIIYYDKANLSKEYEDNLEKTIKEHFQKLNINYEFDLHNEARMHLWKKSNENPYIDKYKNSEDAISSLIATVQSVGITKYNNEIKIYAPYGLSDIFSKTIRPIKHKYNNKEIYDKKAFSWNKRFNNLNIIEW